MIRRAALLIALLIAALLPGHASASPIARTDALPLIAAHNGQPLLAALQDAPAKLREDILQAGAMRWQKATPAAEDAKNQVAEPANARATLIDILMHTHHSALLADAEFLQLHNIVIGESRKLQQPFAETLADYLIQADFGCRQPIYTHYFQRRYAADPAFRPCHSAVPFSILTRYENQKIVWLDPKRVKSIHLLFASKSGGTASRFGHIALRLVLCPEGKTTQEACDANLFEHIVLGFQAHIDEFSLDALKALKGDYKAYLFANRFMDVYEQYAIGEFRELYSLPLNMDDTQREQMVRELADMHWRYAGDYSFLTHNCATMMQQALRASWPEFAMNTKTAGHYLRPDSLFEAVKASTLADASKLSPPDTAERDGYFFSSTREFYDRAVYEVRTAMQSPAFTDLEAYLQIAPASRQQNRLKDAAFMARLSTDRHLREAQIMLEEYAMLSSERALLQEGAKYLEQQNFLKNADRIHTRLDAEHAKVFDDCLLAPIRQFTSPMQKLTGIPEKTDIADNADINQISPCQSAQSKKQLIEAIERIGDTTSGQWQRLNESSTYFSGSVENLNLLKQM